MGVLMMITTNNLFAAIGMFALGWVIGDKMAGRRREIWGLITGHQYWPFKSAKDWIILLLSICMILAAIAVYIFRQANARQDLQFNSYIACQAEHDNQFGLSYDTYRKAETDTNTALFNWILTIAPTVQRDPTLEEIRSFKVTLHQLVHYRLQQIKINAENPPPEPPKEECGPLPPELENAK